MDFHDTPEEARFRDEARTFLQANAEPKRRSMPVNFRGHIGPEEVARAKAWQRKKAEAGFAGITWPKRWGGREASPIMQVIYQQEESNYAVPSGVFEIGLGMCIPTLMQYAGPETLDRFVPPALSGDEIWCQLFSEPAGGSDLAALRTRAEKKGDEWVVNGQKIWTSGAHLSDYGILVVRTDPSVPKHAGLTFFFLSMKSPGIEIRPIHQMSGARHFNEVFFTDVRIPDSQRLGGVGQGWRVSLTTLMNERLAVGGIAYRPDMDDLVDLARTLTVDGAPAIRNAGVREKIADWWVRSQGLKLTQFRTLTALSKGKDPGPENSISKLVKASMTQDIASYGMDLMDAAGAVMDPDLVPLYAMFQQTLLSSPAGRIAGGSDEIMRNIIAERVLGLPGDVRVDKDKPFNQIPTGRG
ncbi:MAG: acyl-CoA dehydrogenase family protein [Acetobacteraceae bacterium]|nr:acyl-CoA dehydrogenase family protein [Acetobacteraceae bacterium]